MGGDNFFFVYLCSFPIYTFYKHANQFYLGHWDCCDIPSDNPTLGGLSFILFLLCLCEIGQPHLLGQVQRGLRTRDLYVSLFLSYLLPSFASTSYVEVKSRYRTETYFTMCYGTKTDDDMT